MVKRVVDATNHIFRQCVCEVFSLPFDLEEEVMQEWFHRIRTAYLFQSAGLGVNSLVVDIDMDELIKGKHKVDDLYQVRIAQLPTNVLNEILIVHDSNRIRRQPNTIENIITELATREVLGFNKSDPKPDNGDADGSLKKSKRNSKKVASKRRKSSKN